MDGWLVDHGLQACDYVNMSFFAVGLDPFFIKRKEVLIRYRDTRRCRREANITTCD